jgi:hypothetical protein
LRADKNLFNAALALSPQEREHKEGVQGVMTMRDGRYLDGKKFLPLMMTGRIKTGNSGKTTMRIKKRIYPDLEASKG